MTESTKTNKEQEMETKKAEAQHEHDEKEAGKKNQAKVKKSKSTKKSADTLEVEHKQQIGELNDKYLRLYSEFDNYRRRTSKEKLDMAKTAAEELIVDLLPVLDDFDRAIKSAGETEDCNAVKEGMNLIHNKLNNILTRKGLTAIDAKGGEFDTDFHEAITYIPAPTDDLKGKVVDEVEKGYKLHDKVIRYSKVVIGQ